MNKIDWKRKLSSRKLWAAAAGVVTGLAMVFGLDQDTITTVSSAVVSAASVVAYILTEGKVDAESAKGQDLDLDAFAGALGESIVQETLARLDEGDDGGAVE